jgi:hypothetical protein
LDKVEFIKAQQAAYLKNQGKPSMNLFSL